jgi:hypothetical protein
MRFLMSTKHCGVVIGVSLTALLMSNVASATHDKRLLAFLMICAMMLIVLR